MRLHDHLDYRASLDPDRELTVLGHSRITYSEGAVHTARLASAFVRNDIPSGSRVAYLSKNSIEFGLFYFAASKAGVVPVPLNYRLVPREWQYIIDDAGAVVVFAQGEFADGIDSIRGQLPSVEHFVAVDFERAGWEPLATWLDQEPVSNETLQGRGCEDAYQMYTSGTTGRPKGVVVSQASLQVLIAQWRLTMELQPNERMLVVAPIFHAAGTLLTVHTVASGGTTYVMTDFDAAEVADVLDQERIGFGMLVPAMIQALLTEVPDLADREYLSLRAVMYGAAAIAEPTLRNAIEVFGCEFVQAFGMTEMPNLVYLTADDHELALAGRPELLLSAGRPGPGSEMKIVDEDDEPVPAGVVGEICGRGGQVMSRYWNLPDATEEALKGGWMHTGDAGYVDDDGYLFIKDRIKDMISSGGENVYPREVEDVLFGHPAVADAAVIGIPSDRWGESVHGVIVLRDGHTATEADLIDFCRGEIAGYKRPRSIEFVGELPRNASGKLLKRELRSAAWQDRDRSIG